MAYTSSSKWGENRLYSDISISSSPLPWDGRVPGQVRHYAVGGAEGFALAHKVVGEVCRKHVAVPRGMGLCAPGLPPWC